MKKIIMSLSMIVAVVAVIAASTGAFFSDTETSTGNTFTAGAIDLLVDSDAHYNGFVCAFDVDGYYWTDEDQTSGNEIPTEYVAEGLPCNGSWTETDLGLGHQFFDYEDLKPGDWGENTISLHVYDNDAYVCAVIDNMEDLDNDQTEPELDAGDDNSVEGELSDEIHFFAWEDNYSVVDKIEQCDNIWNSANENMLFSNTSGPASDVIDGVVYPLYTPTNGMGALAGDTKTCIGLYWCYGEIDELALKSGELSCNGSSVTNMTQTDSLTTDISFVVEQARHNENFVCPVLEEQTEDIIVRTDDLAQSFSDLAVAPTKWFFYNDTNDTIMTINQFTALGGVNDIVLGPDTVGAAQMTLDTGVNPRYNIATYKYKDVPLASISSLRYRIYDASVSAQTPFLNFNVDFDNSDNWQRRLVMVPTGLAPNVWTTVDAIDGGNALWTHSGPTWPAGVIEDGTKPGTVAKTWASILVDYPSAETRSTDSWLGVRVGHPGPAGETAYVDWIDFDGEITNFEN